MIFIKQITNEIGKKCVSLQVIKSYRTFVMTETDNNISDKKLRLTIRFSRNNMAFTVGDPQENGMLVYEPYEMNMGISVAANLREAFKVSELLQSGYKRLLAEIDTPVMLMPIDDFGTQDIETLYHHTYHRQGNEEILSSILPDLNAIAVFAINKDLKLVIDDHFKDIRIQPLMQSVWTHLYRRSYAGPRRKLYAYFHEKRMEVFSFQQNRFRFSNSYEATNEHDALYYLLYIWKLTGMDVEKDELYIVGDIPYQDWLIEKVKQHLKFCRVINQEVYFNNSQLAKRTDIPYDMKTIYLE
ncbi:PF12864 family protein [Prevotella sp. ICM33]|nr:PF12864 family protein [Prevotella sp. ICM33]